MPEFWVCGFKIRRHYRDTKLPLGTSPEEFAVDVEMWEFSSHYAIAMSRTSEGRETG